VEVRRIGLVVHPSRVLDGVLAELHDWAAEHGVGLGQVRIAGQSREVAEPVEPADCDLLIALGGDGTTLAALREGAAVSRPVLGVACGSVGMLTSTRASDAVEALGRVAAGDWTAASVPGLEVTFEGDSREIAINDVAVLRDGPGQAIVAVTVDGELYARVAGDGLVVATAIGSSAYSMAAGGPVLAPGADGMVVTPLAPHGGCAPPLVTGPGSELELTVDAGFGGVRFDVDGRRTGIDARVLNIRGRPSYATMVRLAGEESRLTGMRRRGLIADSPRVLIRDREGPQPPPRP
jgi:NAD+ kinase